MRSTARVEEGLDLRGKVLSKAAFFAATGYEPHPAQLKIHNTAARFRVLANGRRWGKTLLGAKEVEPLAFVLNRRNEPQIVWIIGPEYDDCEKEFRVIYDDFRKLGVDSLSRRFTNNKDSGNMVIHTNWGFHLECRSAKDPESLVGEGLDSILFVEAGRLNRRVWRSARPGLSDKRGGAMFTGIPEGSTETSLLYDLWSRGQDDTRPSWRSWRMPSWTNSVVFPGGRWDEEIVEAESDLTEDEFRQQYGAEFVERTGRVMKEWDDEVHLKTLEFDPALPLYGAVDYGYTNPFVWLWLQQDRKGVVYVLEEHYITLRDTAEIATEVLLPHPLTRHLFAFYADPARPDDTRTLMRILHKEGRSNTGGELKYRLSMIREALKPGPSHAKPDARRPRIYFDRRKTPRLQWEMREGYRWPYKKSDIRNDSENPMDKDDHGPEALGRFYKGHVRVLREEVGPNAGSTQVSRMKVRRR